MFHSSSDIWGTQGATIAEYPTNPFSTEVSTAHTLQVMKSLTLKDSSSPLILSIAASLAAPCLTISHYAGAVWFYVHGALRFVRHEDLVSEVILPEHFVPLDSQLLIPPTAVLRMPTPAGDCAIFSMLTAALMIAAGIPACFRVVAANEEDQHTWGHVYVVVETEKGIEVLDTSHGKYPGWETPKKFREMDYPI